ncbi:MAG: hypothetical protein ACP5O6_04925 [Candidatus Baltobacteraceae bacterium]
MKRTARPLLAALSALALLTVGPWPRPKMAISPPMGIGRHGMVATEHHYASQVGLDVLKRGGILRMRDFADSHTVKGGQRT